MKDRLDYVLHLLSEKQPSWCRSAAMNHAFERAGFGPVHPYLNQLIEQGYVEQNTGQDVVYRLSKKGTMLHQEGGFIRHTEIVHERRIALLFTLLALIMLALFGVFVYKVGKP